MRKIIVTKLHGSITKRDPLVGGILLHNNNKTDKSIFTFNESIFLLLEFLTNDKNVAKKAFGSPS